jgi:hypothetical protein
MFKILEGKKVTVTKGVTVTFLILFSAFFLCSCATPSAYQSKINTFVAEDNYAQARSVLGDKPTLYGKKNMLLYLLDKGLLLHLSKDYSASNEVFEKAKLKFDELYTKSVTGILSTWVINDYLVAYRGEDFERVMINIFESLNYAMLGNLREALVEAKDVDSKLNLINSRYKPDQKNVYKEDAFARMLMGIFYEAGKMKEDLNDAFISYAKAVEIYERDYEKNYNLGVPEVLKENILAAAQFMGPLEAAKYRAKYSTTKFLSLEEKKRKAEIYLIHYNGFSPVKVEDILPVPLPDGYIVQVAFPRYEAQNYLTRGSVFSAKNKRNEFFRAPSELGEDIGALAVQNLANRKVRVIAKAVAGSVGKYLIEKNQEEGIRKRRGENTATGFKILSSLFNVVSSRADTRCWQTLPSEIRIGRLLLEPGEYDFSVRTLDPGNIVLDEIGLGKIHVSAGEKRFFITRSVR